MGISLPEIAVGRCYLAQGEVRRVLKFGNGRVRYQARTQGSRTWGELLMARDGRFAREAEREVHCDFGLGHG